MSRFQTAKGHVMGIVCNACMVLLISPSVGGVGFAEYVCAHPCFTNYFTEEDPDYIPEDVE
jgi:hypothetical protein